MSYTNIHYVPIFLGLLFPTTFVGTYVASVLLGHVDPASLPYISDVGSHLPESCFFGQALNIAAALMVPSVYIRHRQLLSQRSPYRPSPGLLRAGLWAGWATALGVSMVGNFQWENLPLVHAIGALLTFGVGIPYFWIQVACTYYDPPERGSKFILCLRWIIAMVATISFVTTVLGASVAFVQRGGVKTAENLSVGYNWYIIGTTSEWTMALSMALFILTFTKEFRSVSINAPQILDHVLISSKNNMQEVNQENNLVGGKIALR